MGGTTRTSAAPPRVVLALLTLAMCAAACSPSSAAGGTAPAALRTARVTYTVPRDLLPAVLPATGVEARWSQGLDAFGSAVADTALRACVRTYGAGMPDLMPVAFGRYRDLPDLAFIRRYGFSSGLVPLPSRSEPSAAADSTDPRVNRCVQTGQTVQREFLALYAPLRLSWFKAIAQIGSDRSVTRAYSAFGSCLARRGVRAAGESEFFGLVDQRLATNSTDLDLAADYAICMAPVETVREPMRKKLRARFVTGHRREIRELTQKLMPRVRKLEAQYDVQLCFPVL